MSVAVSNQRVGIDVEALDRKIKYPEILAQNMLHEDNYAEYVSMQSLEDKAHFLLENWTAKEAYLKLLGTGLSHEVMAIHVDHSAKLAATLHQGQSVFTLWYMLYRAKYLVCMCFEFQDDHFVLDVLDEEQLINLMDFS
ncbi:MAG: 4'-phosphopantetheinyl transferase superfamily protein [Eubacteriales bacterium]|nr:4'-phosphopantetheinyl transferase superfamily protein [Eubacteriales bacterium]